MSRWDMHSEGMLLVHCIQLHLTTCRSPISPMGDASEMVVSQTARKRNNRLSSKVTTFWSFFYIQAFRNNTRNSTRKKFAGSTKHCVKYAAIRRPTFLKAYGLVTIIVSQYALQPRDCRGQPYWKAKYIVRPWFLGYVWLVESVSVCSSKKDTRFSHEFSLLRSIGIIFILFFLFRSFFWK